MTIIKRANEVFGILEAMGVTLSRNDKAFIFDTIQAKGVFYYIGVDNIVYTFATAEKAKEIERNEAKKAAVKAALSDGLTDVILNQYMADCIEMANTADYNELIDVITAAYNAYIEA